MPLRGHETIDHTADMGIRGWGATPAEAFEEAAAAMLEIAADTASLPPPSVSARIRRRGSDLAEVFLEFLNGLIAEADLGGIVFGAASIERLEDRGGGWELEATARGVPASGARGAVRVEVKAATLCGAFVKREGPERWIAQCVVDL